MIKRYKMKPVIKEAIQYDGSSESHEEICRFVGKKLNVLFNAIIIPTLEGHMKAQPTDFVVKGIKGEFYPVRIDIFVESYIEVDSNGKEKTDWHTI